MMPLLPAWILVIVLLLALVERLRTPRPVYSAAARRLPDSVIFTPLPESLATTPPGEDIVGYLKTQHEEIKALFAETLAATGGERQARFLALRRLLAAHEATEEELFHPLAERALGANGHAVVVARLEEERAAATTLTSIEGLVFDSMQFEMDLRKLQTDVLKHATREEQEEFPALSGVSSERLQRVRDVAHALYEDSRSLLEGPHLSRDVGPFMAMLNRARDVLSDKAA